jgi:NAD(P)-dependent dehydrogenase (short-subunit alcohol dehydrogenase family)
MSTNPLLLLLGVGPRIGSAVAKQFVRHGYEVAVASRSGNKRTEHGYFFIMTDFSHSSSVPATLEAANAEFGVAPSVVVYNAYSLTPLPKEDELLSISTDVFATDMVVDTVSAYAAAAEAVRGWQSLPQDAQRTFIYTGNV